jgi:glutamine amidotransferase
MLSPSLRLLLVSVEAPPALNAEALQVGKILAELQTETGLVVDVVTSLPLPSPFHQAAGGQLITVPCRLRRWQRVLLRSFAPWVSHRPDWWFLFAWRWRQVARQLDQPPNLIYSRSFPLSSTLAAYRLAKHFGVPWFLHLSDPWCETSLTSETMQTSWHRRWERDCLAAAQRISFTSPTTLARYQDRYPELQERMVLEPNTYRAIDLNPSPWEPSERFRLVQTGSFTLGRWPDALFKALLSLPQDHPLFQDLQLIHAGPVDHHTRVLFRQAGPWLHDLGQVTPARAQELQKQADLLLLVDYHFGSARDAQFLASKLTDYLAIRRPVLAISDVQSASWQFIVKNGIGMTVDHNDIQGILNALLDYWQAWRQRDHRRFELPPPSPAYETSQVTQAISRAAREAVAIHATWPWPAQAKSYGKGIKLKQVVIVPYGTGNISSLQESFEAITAQAKLASCADDLQRADALVLPGVGHFGAAMASLRQSGLLPVLLQRIADGVPTLGICLGFQLLTASSEEAPGIAGLGLLPLRTERLRPQNTRRYKVPHLGWNEIEDSQSAPRLLSGITADQQLFYYANAYGVAPSTQLSGPQAYYHHGDRWLALVEYANIFGVQFHPEKSRRQGLQLLRNFLAA